MLGWLSDPRRRASRSNLAARWTVSWRDYTEPAVELTLTLEQSSCEAGLANDAGERASFKLGMIRNGNGRRCLSRPLLHDDMTATLSNCCKSLSLENLAHLAAGQDPQLTQSLPRLA
jgi:hypothetical protein